MSNTIDIRQQDNEKVEYIRFTDGSDCASLVRISYNVGVVQLVGDGGEPKSFIEEVDLENCMKALKYAQKLIFEDQEDFD